MNMRVGDIPISNEVESEDFSPCHDHPIYQHYQINTDYVGGNRVIKEKLKHDFPLTEFSESGLLTIRFVVNCQGETGLYRSKMIDTTLQDIDLSAKDLTQIYNNISALDKWQPGTVRDQLEDSYYQISFKLINGDLIDIF